MPGSAKQSCEFDHAKMTSNHHRKLLLTLLLPLGDLCWETEKILGPPPVFAPDISAQPVTFSARDCDISHPYSGTSLHKASGRNEYS
jgi:hypothetical protein